MVQLIKSLIGSDKGMALNRFQAIIWINDGLLYSFICASHGLNECCNIA